MIPIGDVFAEHNQLRAGNRLSHIEVFDKNIGRRTAGAAFRSEQFDKNGDIRGGLIRGSCFPLSLQRTCISTDRRTQDEEAQK